MSNSHLPKPIHHRSRKDLEEFVLGSSWQSQDYRHIANVPQTVSYANESQFKNIPSYNIVTDQKKKQSLFDRYNRNNLLLSSCDPLDLQKIRRNPIAYEQNLNLTNIPHKKQIKAKTMQNIKQIIDSPIKNHPQPELSQTQMSKQAKMNEYMFNYRKNAEQKKQKKMKFLDDIEKKLNDLEKEANFLEIEQEKEQRQIKSMLNIHEEIKQQARKNQIVGKLNTAIYQFMPQKEEIDEPKNIEDGMDNIEINCLLDEHHQYSNYLVELADNACRKSKSKEKNRPATAHVTSISKQKNKSKQLVSTNPNKKLGQTFNRTQNSLNQTVKRQLRAPPKPVSSNKLVTTWKDMSRGKKK